MQKTNHHHLQMPTSIRRYTFPAMMQGTRNWEWFDNNNKHIITVKTAADHTIITTTCMRGKTSTQINNT